MTSSQLVPRGSVRVRVTLKMRHDVLLKAAEKLGGIKHLAAEIGISTQTVWRWIHLRSHPPLKATRGWSKDKLESVGLKLLKLTGLEIEELFPEALRYSTDVLSRPIERVADLDHHAIEQIQTTQYRDPVEIGEIQSAVHKALESLTQREQDIVKARFGIGCEPMTLNELAAHFNISISRVLQIYRDALEHMDAHKWRLGLGVFLPDDREMDVIGGGREKERFHWSNDDW